MISYNNSAPKAVNNVGQFGATEGSIGAYKSAAEYAADAKYWALLSQTKYSSVEDILAEVERLYAQGRLLEEDINQLKKDFETQEQTLLGLIQSTGAAIDNTNAATELSKEATQKVLDQLDIISNMSVQATLLPPGSLATGSYDNATGVFSFGIPEGRPGRDGSDGTISDIGNVQEGVPTSDDLGVFIDSESGVLHKTPMENIASLFPFVHSVSINGEAPKTGDVSFDSVSSFNSRKGIVVPQSGDYSVDQITGAASSGVNSDITELKGLTTALTIGQGGTGSTTASEARDALGLGGVATESIVPISKGGTGVNSQASLWTVIRPLGVTPLSSDPVSEGDAATKRYVDNSATLTTSNIKSTLLLPEGASMIGTTQGSTVQDLLTDLKTGITALDDKVTYVTFNQFGAVGDGVTNDAPAIKLALQYALANNMDIRQKDGVFLLDGPTYLDIKSNNVDLTGAVLKPSATWKGQITISQPEVPVTYGVGSAPVNGVNASTGNSRGIGSNYLDGLASNTDLDGCFIQLSTSQPMFIFRDTTYTRVDFNRVYNRGNLENPLKYALGNNATSIKALKIRKDVQTIKGLTIDESLTRNYRIIYINQASRVRLINTSFINRPLTQNFSDSRLEINESYDVIVDGLFAPSVADSFTGTGDIYSYTIGLANSMNVTIKNATANGEGWGATGSNNCANVRFERCDLSRIDFHMPFQNYLKINDCNIGRSGVIVTGIGDLYVTNSTFNSSPDMPGNIIATRPDAGGYFDGDLYMDNVVLAGRRASGVSGNGIINASVTAGQGPSVGSPINPTLFNKITLKDVKVLHGNIETYPGTLITVGRDNALYFPKKIVIDGLDYGDLPRSAGLGLNIDFSRFKAVYDDIKNSESSVVGRYTTDILINNVFTPIFTVTGASFRHNPRVVATNIRHGILGEAYTLFGTNQRGEYEFNACKFEGIRTYYGSNPNGPVSIIMNGGKLWSTSTADSHLNGDTNNNITLNGVKIVGAFLTQDQTTYPITRGLVSRAILIDCEYWDLGGSKLANIPFVKSEATSVTVTSTFKAGQRLRIATGFSSRNNYTVTPVTSVGDNGAIQNCYLGPQGNLKLTYTVSGQNVTKLVISSPKGNEIRSVSLV